ncbi:MAG: LPXTG cell wall anchor domain-containing protein [Vicinamibacteria bacterium]|nr:LPXTG cell wall anchor domain-containing protein [Vicinamibacteria bacterium]
MKQTLAAFLLVTALAAGPAFSQTDSSSMSGVVVSTTSDSLVVRMDDGSQRTFSVDSTTTVPSARLVEGNRITVSYRPLDAGRFQASSVVLFDGPTTGNLVSPSPLDRPTTTRTTDRPAAADDRVRDTDNDRRLPQTASNMSGLALVGCLALFTGLALSAVRRRA